MLRHPAILMFSLIFLFILPQYTVADDSTEVTIGLSLSLTGKYSQMAAMHKMAYTLWADDVNQRGGLLGRPIKLNILDDQSSPSIARDQYRQLILADKVDLLFAPYSSALCLAVQPITEKYGYPLLAAGAAADELWQNGYRYFFGIFTPASRYNVGFLEMLTRRQLKKIALLSFNNTFSKSLAAGTRKWAKWFGLHLVMDRLQMQPLAGEQSESDLVERIKQSGADAVMVCGHFEEAVAVRSMLQKKNWSPKAYFATVGPALQSYQKILGKAANLSFSSSQWEHLQSSFPGCAEFMKEFTTRFDTMPSYHGAAAFAAGQILEKAVRLANGFDRQKIRDIIASLDMMTIVGRFGVDDTGKQMRHFNLIVQWQQGKKEIVWPRDMKTAEAVFTPPAM